MSPNVSVDLARALSGQPAIGVPLMRDVLDIRGRIPMGVSVLAIGGNVTAGMRPRLRPGRAITVTSIRLRAGLTPTGEGITATLWQATEQLAAVSLMARERVGLAVPLAASFAADDTLELRIGEGNGTAHSLYLEMLGTVAG